MKQYWVKIKQYLNQLSSREKKGEVFAEGLGYQKIFIIFVIMSIFGAYYEQILTLVKAYSKTGRIVWELRRGVIYGPLSPIYGVGAILMLLLIGKKKRPWYETFLYGSLLGGVYEYSISFLQEVFTHTVSWDYSNLFLNIGGRTTIPFMIVWGIFTLVFVKGIYPFLSKLIEKIPLVVGTILFYGLFLFVVSDCFISWTALIRSTLRRADIPPITQLGSFYDRKYPDEFLQEHFPNMKFNPRKGGK